MAENITPLNNLTQTVTTIVTVGPGGSLQIFGAAGDQVTVLNGRVSVEIQNQSGADIEVSPTDGAAGGRIIADGDAWSIDLGEEGYQGNLYIVAGAGGPICVTQGGI